MRTLLCVSLSPSLDRYSEVPQFRSGSINRPGQVTALAGGKAINVARSAVALGVRVSIVALLGGHTGRAIRELAAVEGLRLLAVDSGVETRQCQVILDQHAHQLTEIYEPTLPVPTEFWPDMLGAYFDQLSELTSDDMVVLSGRVPPGLPPHALHEMVTIAHRSEVSVAIDSDGPALSLALAAGPDLVKINRAEAAALVHRPRTDRGPGTDGAGMDVADMARGIRALGPRAVIITNGATGATGIDQQGQLYAVHHEPVAGALPVGSGDAFLAGAAAVYLGIDNIASEGDPLANFAAMLITGACAGRANARTLLAGRIGWPALRRERGAVRLLQQSDQ